MTGRGIAIGAGTITGAGIVTAGGTVTGGGITTIITGCTTIIWRRSKSWRKPFPASEERSQLGTGGRPERPASLYL